MNNTKVKVITNIFILLPFLIISACEPKQKPDKISSLTIQAEEFLKTTLKDPSSYQKISCVILDSVRMSKSLEENSFLYDGTSLDSVNRVIENLKANPTKDLVHYIRIESKYRAKNSFGALDLSGAIIYYFPVAPPSGEQFMIFSNKPVE